MPRKAPPDLLTVSEVAELLGTSRQAVFDAISRGALEHVSYGKKPATVYLVPRVAALLYKKTRRPRGPAPKRRKRR